MAWLVFLFYGCQQFSIVRKVQFFLQIAGILLLWLLVVNHVQKGTVFPSNSGYSFIIAVSSYSCLERYSISFKQRVFFFLAVSSLAQLERYSKSFKAKAGILLLWVLVVKHGQKGTVFVFPSNSGYSFLWLLVVQHSQKGTVFPSKRVFSYYGCQQLIMVRKVQYFLQSGYSFIMAVSSQAWLERYSKSFRAGNSLIRSSLIRSFAHFAQIK